MPIADDSKSAESKGEHEAGIIDPTKVVRIALENVVSIASVLLLTEASMIEVPDKQDREPPLPG